MADEPRTNCKFCGVTFTIALYAHEKYCELRTETAPDSSTSTGQTGSIGTSDNYDYICGLTGKWVPTTGPMIDAESS